MSWKLFKLLSFVELSYIANSCVNRDANFLKMSRKSLFVFYVCRCLCAMCKQCQKRESDALELKSQVVVSLHVGAWTRMSPPHQVLWKSRATIIFPPHPHQLHYSKGLSRIKTKRKKDLLLIVSRLYLQTVKSLCKLKSTLRPN